MKIAYLLGSLNRGGTETLLLDVFRNAKQNKLDAIGIYRKGGVLESDFIQSGVTLFKISVERNLISYLTRLRKLLLTNQIDIVHAQQPLDALYACLACIGTGKKIILTLHGFDFADKKMSLQVLKYSIRHTDINIFVSDTQQQYYQQKYRLKKEKQELVYNGVSFDKLDVSTNRGETLSHIPGKIFRDELDISSNALLLGSVGNFNAVRDQLTLCRFLKLLNQKGVNFHFVFVGKQIDTIPELYDNCLRFCQQNNLVNHVSFLGSRTDVPEILQQLDAFLYASNHDTFGIAVVEAMAMGIPVFVNDWGVMNEITDNGKYATSYKTKDEVDLLQQFMLFLQDKDSYQTKAREVALFVRENYSIEKHIQRLKQVYNCSVNSKQSTTINYQLPTTN